MPAAIVKDGTPCRVLEAVGQAGRPDQYYENRKANFLPAEGRAIAAQGALQL